MRAKTFRGGIHPNDNKANSNTLPIEVLDAPKEMIYPLSQHIGAFSEPVVAVGEEVKVGQLIAKAGGFVSANLHASVSGTVTAIRPHIHPTGNMIPSIVIENDGQYTIDHSVQPNKPLKELTPEEIIGIVQNAGIVGMGGATFPTHVKLSPPKDKNMDTVIVNGAECEPYLTSDHRVMLEDTFDVLSGLLAAMKAVGVKNGYVAVETNKKDAIEALEKMIESEKMRNISVVPIQTKYPQGSEKQLIQAVTGREVPPGGLPADVGVVVINIDTANAISKAIRRGMPLVKRIVTVCGDAVNAHKNYKVRIGTPIKDIIEAVGGFKQDPAKVILGGPMMGTAIFDLNVPVIKGTGAVLCLTEEAIGASAGSKCMRCGKCVEACPMRLEPLLLNSYAKIDDLAMLEKLNIMDCMECGACAYLCPGRQSPVQNIRMAKQKILAERKKEGK